MFPDHHLDKIEYREFIDDGDDYSQPGFAQTQKTITAVFGKRGIRLDAYFDSGEIIYNIEMQTTMSADLAKRFRLYQSQIDVDQLERGQTFDKLRPCYVIFICKHDPFGKGLYRYSFSNKCDELPYLKLDDGAHKVVFYTGGTNGTENDNMMELLKYMNDTKSYPIEKTKHSLIKEIDDAVAIAKTNPEWRRNYVFYTTRIRESELKGRAEGFTEGEIKGELKGVLKGELKAKLETARRMFGLGISIDTIAAVTQLPVDQLIRDLNGVQH
jgi:predicted transposase/invertase (TIGR01784 family)